VTPDEWRTIVRENARADADGYFLSCTNTRMIEAVADIEREMDKPVVSSNGATLWACLNRVGVSYSDSRLGRLFS
jgi:maleate cis-trans isomerase